jgi:2-keto-4-pentenoate hydratase/2-oxohepta-3-ene-1,7-dioic acid hydratase in catechol pathway
VWSARDVQLPEKGHGKLNEKSMETVGDLGLLLVTSAGGQEKDMQMK